MPILPLRMDDESLKSIDFHVPFTYRLRFTRDVFDPDNSTLADVIAPEDGERPKAVVLVDQGVLDAWPDLPEKIDRRVASIVRLGGTESVSGGEAAKNDDAVVKRTQQLVNEHHICRQSYIIAIGGGAMLDAVGYGAATAHRGVRLIRIPTTTLAQGDAGIGVKNGINRFGKKNFVGSFTVPWAVINDFAFLTTLSDRDWRSGLSEAVKVALVKDAAFFQRIENCVARLRSRDERAIEPIVQQCAELHLRHIVEGGDPFEMTNARPLDFGHWAAHKLEQMTNFEMRHGEAVAIGMAIDVMYSALAGRLAHEHVKRIYTCLSAIGFALSHQALKQPDELLAGLEEFREHLGGRLTIPLLSDIGRQVDIHEIDTDAMRDAIHRVNGRQ